MAKRRKPQHTKQRPQTGPIEGFVLSVIRSPLVAAFWITLAATFLACVFGRALDAWVNGTSMEPAFHALYVWLAVWGAFTVVSTVRSGD